MHSLLDTLAQTPAFRALAQALETAAPIPGAVESLTAPPNLALPRAARLPVVAALWRQLGVPVVWVTDRADKLLLAQREIALWLGEKAPATEGAKTPQVLAFPEPPGIADPPEQWDARTRAERLHALSTLAAHFVPGAPRQAPLILTTARALVPPLMPRRAFLKAARRLKPGQRLSPTALARDLVALGYEPATIVTAPGQFARRGGLLDFWPPTAPHPIRLDFFGDELDTLRAFDPSTQRTTRRLESALLAPAREMQPEAANTATLLDYLPPRAVVLFDDWEAFDEAWGRGLRELAQETPDLPLPQPDFRRPRHVALGPAGQAAALPPDALARLFRPHERYGGQVRPFLQAVQQMLARGETVIVVSRQAPRLRELWREAFGGKDLTPPPSPPSPPLCRGGEGGRKPSGFRGEEERSISLPSSPGRGAGGEGNIADLTPPPTPLPSLGKGGEGEARRFAVSGGGARSPLTFLEGALTDGFALQPPHAPAVHLFTDAEIFGWRPPKVRRRPKPRPQPPEAPYADLKPGDYVVHIDHGIGRFQGIVRRTLEGQTRDYLLVAYAEGDQLFVPIHQADRLTRYIGPDDRPPAITRLGSGDWQRAKSRVREAVQKMAEELLELYARRRLARGHAFAPDTDWQRELEASFPYLETEDQRKAIAAVKRDMESPRPMDRLICGDVGYGKTEVALRAAFKAVMDGKQVAMLVPTTVLAQQHFRTFRRRLAPFPVEVEMLSRFRTPAEQREILHRLAEGQIDIIIGTHRLLSGDVQFKDLGLVIIDEEQRFGVAHKEHFKRLRTAVDVLTLTATPIPRTLYMALTGVRDISVIETPPAERLPVITHVGPYDPEVVRRAILRELDRGGQVFFVHNRVQTIDAMRRHLERLVPEARIAVGHGQMPEKELAQVMEAFANGEVDVLLSTTIIESGLDFPNANTLIVDRADAFGLAQLYQLRGRVGRGPVQAYAYFFRHRSKAPTPEGRQRLEILAEHTALGAGYTIAMRDLEMRGAGEILGSRQHGHMAAVGFHLYTRLLAEAVRRLRESRGLPAEGGFGAAEAALAAMPSPVSVELPLEIGFPPEYIPEEDTRLALYRRLAEIRDPAALEEVAAELRDRFGPLPPPAENLLYQMRVKIWAERAGIAAVRVESGQVVLQPPPAAAGQKRHLPPLPPPWRTGKRAYWLEIRNTPQWQEAVLEALERLATLLPRQPKA